ncbi:hypothetical protein [Nocardioides sp. YIM 152315]|nr:hypothetical protein [Nocardioides sp. YIM 152315]MDF1603414.1 hypothetical protein [Nocardioides sp. YIM 152315]
MAALRFDEGLLGWLLTAAAAATGVGLCALGAYLGSHLARIGDDHLADFD